MTIAPTDPMREIQAQLANREAQVRDLLGPGVSYERFKTVALHAVNSNKELLRCTPLSIVEAIREAAALRLEPTGLLGDAYLVRYGDQAKLIPGYRGLMKLARRSGGVDKIDAQVVYDGDAFAIHLGTDPEILHDPVIDGERGAYTGAYAYARMATGEVIVEWMSVADIEQVRRSSKAGQSGPWVSFWGEMARKSVLRRLMKRLPLDTVAEAALSIDAEVEQAPQPVRARPVALSRIHEKLGIESGAGVGSGDPDRAASPAPEVVGQAEPVRPVDDLPLDDDELPPMP